MMYREAGCVTDDVSVIRAVCVSKEPSPRATMADERGSVCVVTPPLLSGCDTAADSDDEDEWSQAVASEQQRAAAKRKKDGCEVSLESTRVTLTRNIRRALCEQSPSKAAQAADNRTGLIFQVSEDHCDASNRFHPERPLRVIAVRNHLFKLDISSRCIVFDDSLHNFSLQEEDYRRVHLPAYLSRFKPLRHRNAPQTTTTTTTIIREAQQYSSIYLTPHSLTESKMAATSLCHLVSKVVRGELHNGFAVIRPPGHHATPSLAGGYCILNNVAIAAAFARANLGLDRVMIVDWDVHHGNGTQSIFYDDRRVLFVSVHRSDSGRFFPYLRNEGSPSSIGAFDEHVVDARGFNINIAWNRKGMGNTEYLAAWERVVLPVAREFRPQLILISAGFDAAQGDRMGECCVTPECFETLTRRLMMTCSDVVCALEGGYQHSILAKCVESVVGELLRRPQHGGVERKEDTVEWEDVDESAVQSIQETIVAHAPFWTCFQQ